MAPPSGVVPSPFMEKVHTAPIQCISESTTFLHGLDQLSYLSREFYFFAQPLPVKHTCVWNKLNTAIDRENKLFFTTLINLILSKKTAIARKAPQNFMKPLESSMEKS